MLFRLGEETADLGKVSTVLDRLGRPHTLVTGYARIRAVLADPQTYRPENALDAVTPIPVSAMRVLARYGFRLPPTLASNGGPSHPALREITARALHPDRVAAQRPWLESLVAHRVEGLAARLDHGHPVDLYADLAADLPLLVLARLVELPDRDALVVKEFSRAALELFWAPLEADHQRRLAETVGRYHAVLRDFAATAGGLVGELRDYTTRQGLAPDVPVAALFFLLVAGQETTSQFLTLLLHRLISEPSVLSGLSTMDISSAEVVEEGLRLVPPIVTWRRVAARRTELAGVAIPAGGSVVLWLAGAGRDPALTAAPDEFRPGQPGSRRHLAFGAGAHRCLGAQLARMEAAVVVEKTAPLLRDVAVVRAPWCPDNLSFRLPDALVVRASRAVQDSRAAQAGRAVQAGRAIQASRAIQAGRAVQAGAATPASGVAVQRLRPGAAAPDRPVRRAAG
jgi:cytochrome P450